MEVFNGSPMIYDCQNINSRTFCISRNEKILRVLRYARHTMLHASRMSKSIEYYRKNVKWFKNHRL